MDAEVHEASLAIGALAVAPRTRRPSTPAREGDIYFYTSQFPLSSLNASYNGAGVLKSKDGGDSWTLHDPPAFVGACFYRIAVDPDHDDNAFAATNVGLYRTKNGGGSWTQLTNGLPAISGTVIACTDIVIDPTDHNVAYAAFWGSGIYKTTNATAGNPMWTARGLPTTDLSRISLALSHRARERLRARCERGAAFAASRVSEQRRDRTVGAAAGRTSTAHNAQHRWTSRHRTSPASPESAHKAVRTSGLGRDQTRRRHPSRQPRIRVPRPTTSRSTRAATAASTSQPTVARTGTTSSTKVSRSRSSSSSGSTRRLTRT